MDDEDAPTPAQLHVRLAPVDADLVAGLLWELATTGIEEQASPGGVVLVAGFADRAAAERASRVLTGPGPALSPLAVEVLDVRDDGWLDAWRAHARVERAGPFAIVPPWLDPSTDPADADADADVESLCIDPGRAFGSGSHPTTRLVLVEVARLVRAGDRVLDVGCGSGVLAIAAARRGATDVVAVDIDPAAVRATTANAAANAVADRVRVSGEPLDAVAGTFDVVLANLLAPDIVRLADALVARVAPAGALVVCGLLADRWLATTAHLAALHVERARFEDGWAAVTLRP